MQLVGKIAYAHGAMAYQPRNKHDGQTRTQTEDDRQYPAPRSGKGNSDVDHCDKIYQAMRAESDGEKDTQHERP